MLTINIYLSVSAYSFINMGSQPGIFRCVREFVDSLIINTTVATSVINIKLFLIDPVSFI